MSQERLSTGAFSALGGGNWPGHHPANRCCVGVKATSPASLSFLPGHSWPGQPLHQRPSGSGLPPRLIGRDSLLQRRPQYPGNHLEKLAVDQAPATPLPPQSNIRGETY
jgi:hypothetical protein